MAKDNKEEDKNNGKVKRKEYEKALHKLQVELCHLQAWVKETGARIILIFEGRDGAGKGGTIREPACVPRGGLACPLRSRKDADVPATLHDALPGGG